MRHKLLLTLLALAGASFGPAATAADIRVLTTGAVRPVLLALLPEFEKTSGHKVILENETAGALLRKIEGGAPFDVVIITPDAIATLLANGKVVAGSRTDIARVGVGVMVRAGASAPDLRTVEAFKQALLNAKSVAYIDPASGGSSGIYIAQLLEKLGIADRVKPKAKLKQGGHVADLIVSGEAELGIQQISEILTVEGVTLVGPLPAEIQNYTLYAAGLSTASKEADAAKAFVAYLTTPLARSMLKARGLELPAP